MSLVEAEYIRLGLSCLSSENLSLARDRAELARSKTEELKKQLYTQSELPESHLVGHWRVPCPMLSAEKQCVIYEHRPVTCRAYGLPTSIGERGHVCGFSAFDKGTTYPTIKLDQINTYLKNLSEAHAAGRKLPTDAAQKRIFLYEIILLNS